MRRSFLVYPQSLHVIRFISTEQKLHISIVCAAGRNAMASTKPEVAEDGLAKQDLENLDVSKLTPLTPEVISRQATINIGERL